MAQHLKKAITLHTFGVQVFLDVEVEICIGALNTSVSGYIIYYIEFFKNPEGTPVITSHSDPQRVPSVGVP